MACYLVKVLVNVTIFFLNCVFLFSYTQEYVNLEELFYENVLPTSLSGEWSV